jgi:polar amino acid transport system ATP-binding protein
MALLSARDIHKKYDQTEVLKGIDLDIEQGQVVALIGASGSGKTTFLRCINLLEEYHQGRIELDGEAIGYAADGRRRRLGERQISAQRARIGMVFQSFNLFPHMTAEANVMLGLTKVRGMAKSEAEERARHWLDRVGLTERRQH